MLGRQAMTGRCWPQADVEDASCGPAWHDHVVDGLACENAPNQGVCRLVVERLNAGDVDGSVALCEPDAVMALPRDGAATGVRKIRSARERSVSDHPTGSRTTATREHVGVRLGHEGYT